MSQRRWFLQTSLYLGASWPLWLRSSLSSVSAPVKVKKKGEMIYRQLGRTGFYVSEISLGSSPLPEWGLFREIIDRGVNYIDSSHTYQGGNAERMIGRLCREVGRDKIYVATKFHLRPADTVSSIIRTVEGSLRRLQSDYIDVLMIHGVNHPAELTDERVLEALARLKKAGKYRYQGFSCHQNHLEVMAAAIEGNLYDVIQIGYNVYDLKKGEKPIRTYPEYLGTSGLKPLFRRASGQGIGLVAMKALKVGGRRQDLSQFQTKSSSIYQAMLKWVLANPYISTVVTEMLTYQQMEEDLAVVGEHLSRAERKNLYRLVAQTSHLTCRMCGTCQKVCPQSIPLPTILRYLYYFEIQQKYSLAKEAYARLKPALKECLSCRQCEENCPYQLPVQDLFQSAQKILA